MTTPGELSRDRVVVDEERISQHALADHQGAVVGDLDAVGAEGVDLGCARHQQQLLHGPVPEELLERAAPDARDVAKKSDVTDVRVIDPRGIGGQEGLSHGAGVLLVEDDAGGGEPAREQNGERDPGRARHAHAGRAGDEHCEPDRAGERDRDRAVARRSEPLLDPEDAVERSGVGLLVTRGVPGERHRRPPR